MPWIQNGDNEIKNDFKQRRRKKTQVIRWRKNKFKTTMWVIAFDKQFFDQFSTHSLSLSFSRWCAFNFPFFNRLLLKRLQTNWKVNRKSFSFLILACLFFLLAWSSHRWSFKIYLSIFWDHLARSNAMKVLAWGGRVKNKKM